MRWQVIPRGIDSCHANPAAVRSPHSWPSPSPVQRPLISLRPAPRPRLPCALARHRTTTHPNTSAGATPLPTSKLSAPISTQSPSTSPSATTASKRSLAPPALLQNISLTSHGVGSPNPARTYVHRPPAEDDLLDRRRRAPPAAVLLPASVQDLPTWVRAARGRRSDGHQLPQAFLPQEQPDGVAP